MLAKLLATGVGLGSLAFYISAFFFPEVHRRHDFFWSGVGMFYALVLWVCGERLTGAVLLGQMASVALVIWLGWQTLSLRRARTPVLLQTPATAEAWRGFRQEMAELIDSLLNLTPIGRRLPSLANQFSPEGADVMAGSAIRAASVRKVGYEFVDDLDIQEPLPRPSRVDPEPDTPSKSPVRATADQKPVLSSSKPVPPEAPSASRTTSRPGLFQTGIILKDWVSDVVKSMGPKPPRPVIEIPPREAERSAQPVAAPQSAQSAEEDEANWPEEAGESLTDTAQADMSMAENAYSADQAVPASEACDQPPEDGHQT